MCIQSVIFTLTFFDLSKRSRKTFIFQLNTLDGCHIVGTRSQKLFAIHLTQFTTPFTPPNPPICTVVPLVIYAKLYMYTGSDRIFGRVSDLKITLVHVILRIMLDLSEFASCNIDRIPVFKMLDIYYIKIHAHEFEFT